MANRAEIIFTAQDQASAVIRSLGGQVSSLGRQFGAISAIISGLGVGALVAFTANAIKSAAALDDLSEVTGASVEELSKLEQVAILSGTSMDEVAATSVRLSRSLGEAEDASSGAAKGLAAIGLSASQLRGRDTAEQMTIVAKALNEFQDGAGKTNLALALLGKTGAQQLPFLKDLAEAGELNATITGEQAAQAEVFEKASKSLNIEINRLNKQLAIESIPVLTALKTAAKDTAFAILGVGDSASEIERTNAIRKFAEGAGRALAFVVDAVDGVVRAFQIVGITIGNLLGALDDLAAHDYQAAARGLRNMFEQINAIEARERFSAGFEKKLAGIRESAEVTGKTLRKELDFSGAGAEKKKSGKEEIDEARTALAKYVGDLQRQSEKLDEISEKERALQLLRANPSIDTPEVRQLLDGAIERLDAVREEKGHQEAIKRLMLDQIQLEKSLTAEVLELAGVAEEERKRQISDQIDLMVRRGQLTQEQALKAVKGLVGIRDELEQTKNVGQELGLVFASSLGRFIDDPEGGARGFFKSLSQDVQKLITQLLIVEPLANEIKRIFASSGSGGSSSFISSIIGAVGGLFGGGSGSTGSTGSGTNGFGDPVHRTAFGGGFAMATSRPTIIINMETGVDRARTAQFVEQGVRAGLARSWDSTQRGGTGVA